MSYRRPFRVAVVSHSYVVNENRGKLEYLASLPGYEVLLVVPRRWRNRDTGQEFLASSLTKSALKVRAITAWSLGSGSLITYSPVGIWNALRPFHPHVIHLEEEPWSLAAFQMSIFSWLLGASLTFFTWENLDKKLLMPFRVVRKWVLARAKGAVAGNSEASALLERQGFKGRTAVIPQLGVDPSTFRPTDSPPGNVVGFVGRLVPQKGIVVLLTALAEMSVQYRAVVVGNGPMREAIPSLARRLGLAEYLELHEGVPHSRVPDYLARMTILVLPSLTTQTWKEQFGHVLIEAMACGVPVIGSNSGAIPEVVANAGLIVPEGDPHALLAAIEQLITSPALREKLTQLGAQRVSDHFTNKILAERLGSFLDLVAGEAG